MHDLLLGLLYLGACVGHVAILVFSLNWWYSHPLDRRLLHGIRGLHALLVLAGPLLFWCVYGRDLTAGPETLAQLALLPYLILCGVLGFVTLPALTLWRRLRRRPAA